LWRGRFTPKETKILALLAQGSSCEEIARKLSAPERTVRDYLRGLLCTTGLSELSELAEFTLAHRLLDPPAKEY
jgi:DNA-binding NarL/FixJ family response regulator